jgi:hypothetical protein
MTIGYHFFNLTISFSRSFLFNFQKDLKIYHEFFCKYNTRSVFNNDLWTSK